MDVAVIISVYSKEVPELFKRAMDSIVDQIVDTDIKVNIYLGVDGPIPKALQDSISTYERDIFLTLYFKENRGLVFVLNDLISRLGSESFIFRMDTDDISYPGRLQKQINYMLNNTEIDILGTSIVEFEESSGYSKIVHFASDPLNARKRISRGVPVAHPTVCFRKSVFDKIVGYPPVKFNEDIALWFQCAFMGLKFDNIREPLYEFTISKFFLERRGVEKAWSELCVYCQGIWKLERFTFNYFFPIGRFVFRLLPSYLQKHAYNSRLRVRDIEQS